jgi:hypothetical protein
MIKKSTSGRSFYWHLLLLSSLVFSQPLFNALNSQPEFLLAHNLTGFNLFGWILAVAFLAGLIIVAMVFLLTRWLPKPRRHIRIAAMFLLAGAFLFVQLGNVSDLSLEVLSGCSVVLGGVFVWLYGKSILLRTLLSYFAFLVLLVPPIVFSMDADIRQILLSQQILDNLSIEKPIDKQPVVLLLLDELPILSLLDSKGDLNTERFPNIAEFARQSTWYRYATTTANETMLAVPSILTGQQYNLDEKKLPLASNYPQNLFAVFSQTHKINGFETFTQLCPESLCNSTEPDWEMVVEDTLVTLAHISLPAGLKDDLPQIDNKWVGYLNDDEETVNTHTDRDLHPHHRYKVRMEKVRRFAEELKTVEPISLNYLHVLLPHSPWMYLPDGRVYSNAEHRSFTGTLPAGAAGANIKQQLYPQQHLMDFAYQRHLLQLGYADKLLGELFAILKNRGLYDDALIVLMADHGVSFKAGESLRVSSSNNYQDILSIPLFIKRPGQTQGSVDLRAARSVDVFPSILDILNSSLGEEVFDGRSLLQDRHEPNETISLLEQSGETRQYPFSQFVDRLEQEARNRNKQLVDGSFEGIYLLNGAGLVNRPVSDIPVGPDAGYTLRLDNPHLYDEIDLNSNIIPSLIRASRSSELPGAEIVRVAVSVNGIIQAVATLQQVDTQPFDLQMLVAPGSFREGKNTIAFHQLNEESETTSLSRVPIENSLKAALAWEEDSTFSINFGDQSLPVETEGKSGEVMLIAGDDDEQVRITGWAARSEDGLIADEVFFFAEKQLLTQSNPHLHYPLAEEFTGFEQSLNSGFNLSIPLNVTAQPGLNDFTAIAVFTTDTGLVAAELRYKNWATQFVETRIERRRQAAYSTGPLKQAIELNHYYDFSDEAQAELFTESGWSKQGNKRGRWNEEALAVLNFVVENTESPLELVVEASPLFYRGSHNSHSVEAMLRSGKVQVVTLEEGDDEFVLQIGAGEIRPDGSVRIRLRFVNAVSPESLGMNNDVRPLALNVKSLLVREQGTGSDRGLLSWWPWD